MTQGRRSRIRRLGECHHKALFCRKEILVRFTLGGALCVVLVQLAPHMGLPALQEPTVSSANSPLAQVTTGDSKLGGEGAKGTSSLSGMVTDAMSHSGSGTLQGSTAKISTVKEALLTIVSTHAGGIASSFPREPVAQHTSPTDSVKPLEASRTPKSFNKTLDDYPVVPTGSVRRVIVVTYFRAGSSFVGELLSSTPATFYHFEPLQMFSRNSRLEIGTVGRALELMSLLLRCDFQHTERYLRWAYRNKYLFKWNHFLWALCGGQDAACFEPDFLSQVCARAPAQVVKVTRLHMSQVRDWLHGNPDIAKSVKIVHLVRDPRGILASRRRSRFCAMSKRCIDEDTLCSELRADLEAFVELQTTFPNSVYRVRYEDVSLEPKKVALKLFEALGLNYTVNVSYFLKTHTKAQKIHVLHPFSTRRNSPTVPFQWRIKLKFEEIAEIQRSCSDVLQRLGYKSIRNKDDLFNELPIGTLPHMQPVRR